MAKPVRRLAPATAEAARQLLDSEEPLVLLGRIADWPAMAWSLDQLRRMYGGVEVCATSAGLRMRARDPIGPCAGVHPAAPAMRVGGVGG